MLDIANTLDPLYVKDRPLISGLFDQLRDDQKGAFRQLHEKFSPVFILGPPGSGKSFFLAIIAIAQAKSGEKVLITWPTNGGIDSVSEKIEIMAPELKAIRPYSLNFKTKATIYEAQKFQK